MTHKTRSKNLRYVLALGLLALLMVVALSAVASAQGPDGPNSPNGGPDGPGGPPDAATPTPDTMMPTATPAPTATPSNPGGPGTNPGGPGDPSGPTTDPGNGNGGGDMSGGGMAAPIPVSNRIILHAATPVQLIKTGDGGLHLYFIGADGSTYTGPTFSSFAMLEEMHPSGAAVSLFSGSNVSTGRPITVDYLPDENRIFVKTFYPAGHDKHNPNKAYDFTVDDKYKVKHVNW